VPIFYIYSFQKKTMVAGFGGVMVSQRHEGSLGGGGGCWGGRGGRGPGGGGGGGPPPPPHGRRGRLCTYGNLLSGDQMVDK